MTEGVENSSAALVVSPTTSAEVPSAVPEEVPETEAEGEEVAEDESGDDAGEGDAGGEGDAERGALGLAALAGACCVCLEAEQVRSCLHSEKICILPIIACLLSLALCTAGLKWVFVDKIFEYEPHTHLDPDRIGQDPIISADPTLGLPVSPSTLPTSLFPATNSTSGRPEVFVEGSSTKGPFDPSTPRVTNYTPTSAVTIRSTQTINSDNHITRKTGTNKSSTPFPQTTVESNEIPIPNLSPATSTTPSVRTSSHVTPCNESEKSYCVNGGDCFTLEVTSGFTKKLCRCPNEFTGDRCQTYVMASFYKHLGIEFMAEELYQKRVLTITGICIALLVVGIMCVVAYCKTKKQRQKLHDRLRQSLRERNTMASMANGPQMPPPHPTPENIQLVNQYISKTAPAKHVIEKETETSFSPSQYTSSAHQSTTVTHTSSQSWMNSKHENIVSESRSALVMSSVEGSRQGTPSHRGRLNATGSTRDLGAYLKSTRETPDSSRDSPYSERYMSAMTTPTHLSHVELLSPVTPGSPPSEMSAPLSSLATSVPSVAVSPIVDEDRPLLFLTPPRLRDKQKSGCGSSSGGCGGHGHKNGSGANQCSKRNSAHYNHGQDPSPPPSPLHIMEDDEYESTQEYEATIAATPVALTAAAVTRPPSPTSKKLSHTSAATSAATKRTKPNGIAVGADTVARQGQAEPVGTAPAAVAAAAVSESSSEESSSSDESETEDERVGEDTPFLSIQNPAAGGPEVPTALALRPVDGSRTNPALRLSPQEDLQVRLSSVITNQDPIAV
ncbi:pro-neuregulin-1, membrane-bound isoform isoform X3 [Alosa sapidissima]|uniref:pro-neuregulin-1, membrane-bound isoform isoform X3 n=1 Tax=Alosa sapidissima TaxID=34773 RepID=UPI001C084F40|nr:pro-neuregulin-1, membrane-bound isoform isoform X3 [Alosa sapidissima]